MRGVNVWCLGLLSVLTAASCSFDEDGASDETPPETTIVSGPDALDTQASPTFVFESSETGGSFECRVDNGGYESCSSPLVLAAVAQGPHEFVVRAIDKAGNVDETPAARNWVYELDECSSGASGCVADADGGACANTTGGFSCSCHSGYAGDGTLAGSGCTDIDECAADNGGCGSATYWICANNTGGTPTCTDIDECATDNGGCGSATYWTCANNTGAAPTCTDIDECAANNGGCGSATYWTCANNTGAAPTCTDVDECLLGTDGCSAAALCVNTPGGFGCVGDDPLVCLDGVADSGAAVPMNGDVASLTGATIEMWFKSTVNTGERQLFLFHAGTLVDARVVAASIADATAQNFVPLTGRVIHLVVDARDNNAGKLNARGFDLDAAIPGFDERQWHHYAIVFTGTTQRVFVDGVELTTVKQRDGAQDTSFNDAFGAAFIAAGGMVEMDIGWFARNSDRYLAGNLEDVRVSGVARYTGPFSPAYPLPLDSDTIAVYDLDEGAGTSSYDSSTNNYDISWTVISWGVCP